MKRLPKLLSAILAFAVFVTCLGCGETKHEHTYTEVAAAQATCIERGNIEYYKCDCGKTFVKRGGEYVEASSGEIFTEPLGHAFTKRVKEIEATCTENGVKAHAYCGDCGKWFVKEGSSYVEASEDDFSTAKKSHVFDREVVADEYRVAEATDTEPQKFAKSCVCGKGDDSHALTFSFGKTLAEYKSYDAALYDPHALAVSIYDAAKNVYGFTWNADKVSSRPVLEIREAGSGDEYRVIGASSEEMSSYDHNGADYKDKSEAVGKKIDVNYMRARAGLKADAEYEYRVGDKYLGRYTDYATIKAANPDETGVWRFAHVSDSQTDINKNTGGVGSETYFAKTLGGIAASDGNRFIVHTGDVVEWSGYESYWRYMFDGNFNYLSAIPTMAVSGNHDTTYKSGDNRNGSHETNKHFDYSIPDQSTALGFYYSYSYGGVKFIMINTNDLYDNGLKDAQLKWLKNELENKTEKWTVVALHNPLYSPGKWGSGENNGIALRLAAQLSDLFARYGVDLVLQGHDHVVSKTHPIGANKKAVTETFETIDGVKYSVNPQGVIYVMNGPAGNQARTDLYSNDETLYEYAEVSKTSSWAEFEVSGDKITVYVKNASSGSVVTQKTWGIKKVA